jgi:hypothetical protein
VTEILFKENNRFPTAGQKAPVDAFGFGFDSGGKSW